MNNVLSEIKSLIDNNDVVLFMKGNKNFPQCGFSASVIYALQQLGVEEYKDINVLSNEEIRQGIKDYTNWPTIPQLYIKGEFIGGADIVKEMYQSGELQKLLEEKEII